ncbi:MAG: enoyl-CoA hydratase/isomerase family protein [Hyphomicrobiales bacterium]|nr:enoyl-CoA hydratase/isomerase family protein [Hyphomicrobiales bacterium]
MAGFPENLRHIRRGGDPSATATSRRLARTHLGIGACGGARPNALSLRSTEARVNDEVICEKRGAIGHITLNRPQALNALTLNMVRGIALALDAWEIDPGVRYVVVEGAGDRAFCAGGDIRLLWEQGTAGDHASQLDFWREEYVLNVRIKLYPKPYVAIVDGIVMGGGVGVSEHGSHRIAGDGFAFAMPEVGIGFFPDVGATYFLPRLTGRAGTYLALTGARAKTGDAVALGLADAHIPRAKIPAFVEALSLGESLDATIARLAAPAPPGPIVAHQALIDAAFAASNVAEIIARLDADGSPFAADAAKAIRTKSPTSLAVALRQMQVGASMEIAQAMRAEFRIVSRICREKDFYEGVRATIIDKDGKPAWQPARLEDVTEAMIAAHFAPLGADDLQLAEAAA